jgi:hypothetical protein
VLCVLKTGQFLKTTEVSLSHCTRNVVSGLVTLSKRNGWWVEVKVNLPSTRMREGEEKARDAGEFKAII